MAAERQQFLEEELERRLGTRVHLQRELRELVVGPAEIEVLDLEGGAALDDLVEDGLELLGVDEVALGGHDRAVDMILVCHRVSGADRPARRGRVPGITPSA